MSWFLKAVCGSAGITIGGGPLGDISGDALKTFYKLQIIKPKRFQEIEKQYLYQDFNQGEEKQYLYFLTTFALLGNIVRADKKSSKAELETVERMLKNRLKLTSYYLQLAKIVFNEAKKSQFTAGQVAKQYITNYPNETKKNLSFMLDMMFDVALADMSLHPHELNTIRRVARIFNLLENEYGEVESRYVTKLKKPYSTLGVKETDSKTRIEAKHKSLTKKFDPTKIEKKGIPAEFGKFATKKMDAVEKAYENITKRKRPST